MVMRVFRMHQVPQHTLRVACQVVDQIPPLPMPEGQTQMTYIPRRLRETYKRPSPPVVKQRYLMLPTDPPQYKAIPLEPPMTETIRKP